MSREIDGDEKKKNYSVALEPWIVDKIKPEFQHNLSLALTLIIKDWISRNSETCEKGDE